jgi:LAO/AO transport system kinase
MKHYIDRLIKGTLSGVEGSLSRLLTLVENEPSNNAEIMDAISPHIGKAYRIGITGSPGSGKSTLIDKLTASIRGKGLTVGIVCVDPTSPVTGGAVLGDRIRMEQHYSDEGVFLRSMATRGSYGGLSEAVGASVALLDAFGKDVILVETVGIGQEEIGVEEIVDAIVLVLAPGWGDSMQFMKAGILEVADIIVVNKADYEGAEGLAIELKDILAFSSRKSKRPIMLAQAQNSLGIEELYNELEKYRKEQQP